MYSKEELLSKKYGDLLKILKKLGVKCSRQKAAKVVELILEAQDKTEGEDTQELSSNEDLVVSEERDICDGSPIVKKRSHSGALKARTSDPKSPLSPKKADKSPTAMTRRSRTFVVDSGSTSRRSNSSSPKEKKRSLNRSDTFTVSPSKKRVSSAGGDKEQHGHNQSLQKDTLDLQCQEFQTVEDIEMLEDISNPNSSLNDSEEVVVSPFIKKGTRRSLRGQLLVSNASQAFHQSLTTRRIVSRPSLSPLVEKTITEEKTEKSSEVETRETSKPIEKETVKEKKDSKPTTSIPRFVSYARSIKVPNFAKIHESAFKKMEALDDYVERKQKRADSVKKNTEKAASSIGTKIKFSAPSEMKKLKLAESTPARRSVYAGQSPFSSTVRSGETRVAQRRGSLNASNISNSSSVSNSLSRTKASALPRPVKENIPPKKQPIISSLTKPKSDSPSPSSFSLRKAYVPNFGFKKNSSFRPSADTTDSAVKAQKSLSAIPARINTNRANLKQMAMRRPKVKTSAEMRASQNTFIKGVRSNRRFELQMAKRGIKI